MTDLRRGIVYKGTLLSVKGDRAEVQVGNVVYRSNVGFVSVDDGD